MRACVVPSAAAMETVATAATMAAGLAALAMRPAFCAALVFSQAEEAGASFIRVASRWLRMILP